MNAKPETSYSMPFNKSLFERMQTMNRSRLDRLREIHRVEAEFGGQLLSARSPSEATTICGRWMATRLQTAADEHHAFAAAWLDLISDLVKNPTDIDDLAETDMVIWRSGPNP
jgi:hypothetical protein